MQKRLVIQNFKFYFILSNIINNSQQKYVPINIVDKNNVISTLNK
jgi:hypothetical protein